MMYQHDALVDALVEARLENLHLAERDLRRTSPSWAIATRGRSRRREALPRPSRARASIRVRVGRVLVVAGAAIAGEDDAGKAQRAA